MDPVSSTETKMSRNEEVKNWSGPCLHHLVILLTSSLSFSAQQLYWMGMWPQMLPSEPLLGEQESRFALETTKLSSHACYQCLSPVVEGKHL